MIARIREVRRARGMTLDDVAQACEPQTTPQTIGRLETGTRTVSVGWLNRIAKALGVDAQDLVQAGKAAELKVAAMLGPDGATAAKRAAIVVPPRVDEGQVAVIVSASVGQYHSGDEIWCETLRAEDFYAGTKSRRARAPHRRSLHVRAIDQRRWRETPSPAARGRQPTAGGGKSALARRSHEARSEPLTATRQSFSQRLADGLDCIGVVGVDGATLALEMRTLIHSASPLDVGRTDDFFEAIVRRYKVFAIITHRGGWPVKIVEQQSASLELTLEHRLQRPDRIGDMRSEPSPDFDLRLLHPRNDRCAFHGA